MGCNTGSAWIEFPARFLDDAEIRECLEEIEDVKFEGGLPVASFDDEATIDEGTFHLYRSEVCYGYFEDLEDLLKKKAVPFNRHTNMDWDIYPCDRFYRPVHEGTPEYDHEFILNPSTDEICVSLEDIRELLGGLGAHPSYDAAAAITEYLDEHFPAYPPLADWVKEG